MAIINMLQRTLVEVVELVIMIEKEMPIRKKSIVKYCQDSDNEESEDSDEEEKQKPKKKKTKYYFETIRRGVYCQNYYNEGHFTKECKLLNKFC
jgi:hypothetical protein